MVVPFGCATLVLRDVDERAKFTNRAVLMIFVHYSTDHSLFTYALYSPRTKRILHRQDVIFLTSVFPTRSARVISGMGPDGDTLKVTRSPSSILHECPTDLSFGTWTVTDALPPYDDDVHGFDLSAPYRSIVEIPENLEGVPVHIPDHPCFPSSSVVVPIPAAPSPSSSLLGEIPMQSVTPPEAPPLASGSVDLVSDDSAVAPCIDAEFDNAAGVTELPEPRRSARRIRFKSTVDNSRVTKRRVQDRWYYAPVTLGTPFRVYWLLRRHQAPEILRQELSPLRVVVPRLVHSLRRC